MVSCDTQEQKYLSLVGNVCRAQESHIGINDKDQAEFIIHLCKESKNQENFKKKLIENEADFDPDFIVTQYTMIQEMNDTITEKDNIKKVDTDDKIQYKYENTNEDTKFVNYKSRKEAQQYPSQAQEDGKRSHDWDYDDKKVSYTGISIEDIEDDKIPKIHEIYRGKVTSLTSTGAIISFDQFLKPYEGFLHSSAIIRGSGYTNPYDILKKNQYIYVKVLSILDDSTLSLSARDVEQDTGKDLHPIKKNKNTNLMIIESENKIKEDLESITPQERQRQERQKVLDTQPLPKRRSSRERWELQQLSHGIGIIGGNDTGSVKSLIEYQNINDKNKNKNNTINENLLDNNIFKLVDDVIKKPININDTTNIIIDENNDELEDEEIDIEINDKEPIFLKGQINSIQEKNTERYQESIQVVRVIDGSLQKAALSQIEKTRERRELREFQRQQMIESLPKDLSIVWDDPMSKQNDRHFASDLRSVSVAKTHLTEVEWRKETLGSGVIGKLSELSIKEQRESLPIYKLRDDFLNNFKKVNIMVVVGQTGSGKTTQMTQYLAESGYTYNNKIIGCTQPRRVAAISIAKRVAEEVGCKIGMEVGYTVRFEDCTSKDTRIKYMTDGILLREIQLSPNLEKYSVIILDEAHERTVNTDILFGLLKSTLKRRKDLKIIITSASLEADKFSEYFNNCKIYKIPGRMYPVKIHHVQSPEDDYLQSSLHTVMQIHLSKPPGDILLFLTGKEEIDTACEYLYEQCKMLGPKCPPLLPLPVYSALDSEQQAKIFEPTIIGTRKCVVATNIAETSLTIDGIYYVIDPGFCKINVYDPRLGKDEQKVVPISQASAKQRAGRAGRTGPGECYRLYTQQAFLTEMLPSTVPEIQRRNLAEVVLMLKAMGINDMLGFEFMDPPPVSTMLTALKHLYYLGALDEEGLLTRLGRRMAEFPLSPELSKVLIAAVDLQCTDEILTIVAIVSDEDIFSRPKDKQAKADIKHSQFFHSLGDHFTFLRIYKEWQRMKYSSGWCIENFINNRAMRKAQDVRQQLCTIMERYHLKIISCGKYIHRICRSIASGYFMNVAKKQSQEGYKTLVESQNVFIHPSSSLYMNQPEWILYHKLILTSKEYLHYCMVIDPKWLIECAPTFYKNSDSHQISKRRRGDKLEPLFDRYHDPNAWRLSRRRG